MMTTDSIL